MENKVFENLKVLDFSRVIAGPLVTEYLSQLGATVIKVESKAALDTLRISAPYKDNKLNLDNSGYFAAYNANKYSLNLNLKNPESKGLLENLVKWCDILVENFKPGTMEEFDLGYSDLIKIKPDLIMLSTSNQGQTGTQAATTGYGFTLCALSGFTNLTGWPDREPCHPFGAITDYFAPWMGLISILAAIDYRDRTGLGQYLDVSQFECGLYFLSPILLDFITNQFQNCRQGNHSSNNSPHAAFRCSGEDSWCSIAVENDTQWRLFCQIIDKPELAVDPRFCSLDKRKTNESELDAIISDWTIQKTSKEVMEILQSHCIAAGIVQRADELMADAQLNYRQHFQKLEHPEIGVHTYELPGFRLSMNPQQLDRPAPCLGQHNEFICREILKISDDYFLSLLTSGVFD